MAADIDGYGQPGYVGGRCYDMHLQRCCCTAKPGRPDAQAIDALEQFLLQRRVLLFLVLTCQRQAGGTLGHEGSQFKTAP